MAETQKIFNIEKQEPQRDLYNIAGNLIINPITHEPVYIPSIQSVLRKGETTKGDFFKKEPEWVDYEQGFIVERKEVDEIIKKLENNKIQLVLGAPASGKSIILKNVGYKLANQNKVYVVELKKHPEDKIKLFFENIPKMDNENPIFIIDDAHLRISDCESLIRNFKGRGYGKLIIGSREIEEIKEGDPTETSEFERLSKKAINIKAEDVTEEIIKTFLKKQHNLDEDKIRTASESLEIFKKDLWYLSWALKVFDSDNYSVDGNQIFKNIKKRIEKIKAEDVFFPLSVFFRYEIPIERKFLEKQLGIKESLIDDLIGLQEIVETEEIRKPVMLSLHHSSIADLYYIAYQNYPDFGEEIKEKILNQEDKKDLEFSLFCRYMTTTEHAIDIVIHLGAIIRLRYYMVEDYRNAQTLLNQLAKEEKIQKSIVKGIEKEEDIKKIGECINHIDDFSYRIGMAESHYNMRPVMYINKKHRMAQKLVKSIDVNVLSSKIDNEEDIEEIGNCLSYISFASKEVELKLVKTIDIKVLSSKIDNEEDIEKIGSCLSVISRANNEVAMKLLGSIDIKVLSSKIHKEGDIEKIGKFVFVNAMSSEEVALNLVKCIDINVLSSKIDKEDDIEKIGNCLSHIAFAGKEEALKLVKSIDINVLSSKINTKEILNVGWCVSVIARSSKEVALKLANSIDIKLLSSKINKEEDIGNIGSCIHYFAEVNKEVALKLVDSIDNDALFSKIEKEKDRIKVWRLIYDIEWASKELANKIITRLNPKLKEELQ